ncbi:MAG: hypothetical protein Q9184_007486 [Pyrenodesmia sp. 2 TL-2023]
MAFTYVDQSTQTEEHHHHEPHTSEKDGNHNNHNSQQDARTAIVMRLSFVLTTMGLLNLALAAGNLFEGADLVPKNPSTMFPFAVLLGVCTGMGVSCVGLPGKDWMVNLFRRHPRCVSAVPGAKDDDDVRRAGDERGDGAMGLVEEAEEIKKQGHSLSKRDFQIWDDEAIYGLEWPVRF